MTKVILLNGPPRCGKDTLAEAMWNFNPSVFQEKFAAPLKEHAPQLYGVSRHDWKNNYDTPAQKDMPQSVFLGKSARQIQIALSETFYKPLHGSDVFGRLLVSRVSRLPKLSGGPRIVVVSDSGFRDEAEAVVNHFGAEHTFLVRLYRTGSSYDGDSRGYIRLADMGVREIEYSNQSGVDVLARFGQHLLRVVGQPRLGPAEEGGAHEAEHPYQCRISKAWEVLLEHHLEEERLKYNQPAYEGE